MKTYTYDSEIISPNGCKKLIVAFQYQGYAVRK